MEIFLMHDLCNFHDQQWFFIYILLDTEKNLVEEIFSPKTSIKLKIFLISILKVAIFDI